MQLPLTGSCQCGNIRYEITQTPQLVYTCHCTDCQRVTSSTFSLGIALPDLLARMKRRPLAKGADAPPIGNTAEKDEPGIAAARKSEETNALCIDLRRYGGADHKIDKPLDILRTFSQRREVVNPAHI